MDELTENIESKINLLELNNATLYDLPSHINVPNYDRSKLNAGIVHIGVGNFHRAHLSWYIHRLLERGMANNWSIIGGSVRKQDSKMRDKLLSQDFLTTLIELDPNGDNHAEIVGAMIDYVPIDEDNKSLIQIMANPQIKIVSMTITEGGYYQDPISKKLDSTHPDIIYDLQNPDTPRTVFGAIIAALKIRKQNGYGPFTGLCCDNLQENGTVLHASILGLAKLSNPELAEWIDANCSFPNSMVDCIVPATGAAEKELVQSIGVNDAVPVTHENFRQWVIEDNFCAGRPDLELVGVTFSDKVYQYETQKIRILNGGHQILANTAEILGLSTIYDAMANPLIRQFFSKVEQEEILPNVSDLPDLSTLEYLQLISSRFANKSVMDTVRRVSFDGSSRHPGFILPSIYDNLRNGGSLNGLALVEAAWARMCEGTREDGTIIEANDPDWSYLHEHAKAARHNPKKWLEMEHIYGNLINEDSFASAFERWLKSIYENGIEQTMRIYLDK